MIQWINSLYGNYRTRKFTDIFESFEVFKEFSNNCPIPQGITDESLETLYYLLYARYGNSHITSSDENQWIFKVFSTIFMYGPTWEKRLEIQQELRDMTLNELKESAKAIYNHAYNPSTQPATDESGEHIMDYINDQNVTLHRRSKTDAYAILLSLLETDVTKDFIDKFKKLFLSIVEPELPLWYVTDNNLDNNIGDQ